uniref:Secreted protein n=1 Tax=Rhipicephalus microplus TaxID=6941 RepID=A0A6G5A1C2_RHIMP
MLVVRVKMFCFLNCSAHAHSTCIIYNLNSSSGHSKLYMHHAINAALLLLLSSYGLTKSCCTLLFIGVGVNNFQVLSMSSLIVDTLN